MLSTTISAHVYEVSLKLDSSLWLTTYLTTMATIDRKTEQF